MGLGRWSQDTGQTGLWELVGELEGWMASLFGHPFEYHLFIALLIAPLLFFLSLSALSLSVSLSLLSFWMAVGPWLSDIPSLPHSHHHSNLRNLLSTAYGSRLIS